MNVADWLHTLGLGQYEAAFRENSVTADLLPNLTPDDLKDLGVTLVGHRRRLLDAISALRPDADRAEIPPAASAEQPRPAQQSTAERRQLSVMFCDLLGSTPLSSRLDPEELSAVIRGYQARVAPIIERFGGFIARYVGDGVLIYFGWPEAHEANAERAVRAALAVVEAIRQTPVGSEQLQIRIGIATGLVVIGEPIGRGDARQQTAVGETPNLAARLQGLAGANGIAIDATTRRQLGGLFNYRDLGELELKGFMDRVPAWLVLGERNVASRFEALHADALVAVIGRDSELATLDRCWRQAKKGTGQVVVVSGEAGIGKSRLIAELDRTLQVDPPTRLRYFCSPDQTETALYPVIAAVQHEAGFTLGDSDAQRLNKLRSFLASTTPAATDIALIADLLSIPLRERPSILDASPQVRKEATFATLLARFQSLAQANPLLVTLEDAHWADASSIEFFNAVIFALIDVASLVIITTRTEDTRSRLVGNRIGTMTLSRLDRRQAAELATSTTNGANLPKELLNRIVEQTDGIPLFVEELTKMVLETASEGAAGGLVLAVPASLQASLMARLDRISLAKEVAQVAAIFGREFPHNLLNAIAGLPEAALRRGLQQLLDSGLASRDGSPPDANYTFKHALVRDTAYSMLLRSRRRKLHSMAAMAIEEQSPDSKDRQPELLAHHYSQAGQAEPAVFYWTKAARRSVGRSALIEAVAQFQQALELVPLLPEEPARLRQEMELQTSYAGTVFALQAWADGLAMRAYARALELAEKLGDVEATVGVLAGQVTYHIGQCQYGVARQIAEKLLHISEASDLISAKLIAHRCMGICLHWTGDFRGAIEHFDRVLTLYEPGRDRQLASILGFDVYVQAAFLSCWDLLIIGDVGQAVARFTLAREQLPDVDHKHSRVLALGFGSIFSLLMRNRELALRQLAEAVELATEQRFTAWIGISNLLLGSSIAETDHNPRGLEQARAGYMNYVAAAGNAATGLAVNATCYLGLLAAACDAAGIPTEACVHLDAAIDAAQRSEEHWFEPELHRLKGEWLRRHEIGGEAQVELAFLRAIHLARQQQARFWELRSSISLAQHYVAIGAWTRALDLLSSAVGPFGEDHDFPDLCQAKAMLAQLEA